MRHSILGIDIAKSKFDVVLLHQGKQRHRIFSNCPQGFEQLSAWLVKQEVKQVHACLEVTGTYGEALGTYLYQTGHQISMVNPLCIQAFGQSQLTRNKTDKVDAKIIALYCQSQNPELWSPLPTEIQELQALVRRLDDLMEMRHQEMNRIKASCHLESVQDSLQNVVAYLEQQIKTIKNLIGQHIQEHPLLLEQQELLISIPGIAEITAAKLLAEIPNLKDYKTARQAAAYAGLTPKQRVSGTSVRGKTCLSKTGNVRVGKALYMPAVVAQRHNPILKQCRDRLRQKGKHPMAILGALMRKLLHIAYGVIKTGKPFDPNYGQIG